MSQTDFVQRPQPVLDRVFLHDPET